MRLRLLATGSVVALGVALTACSDDSNVVPVQAQPSTPAPTAVGAGSVWVADEGSDGLSVLDVSTNKVHTTVAGVTGPHNVQVSRDGTTVYAVSSDNMVVALDATTYTVNAVAPTGAAPAHVIEAPNGKVYVTNADDGSISVYQAPGLQPDGRIDLGGMPHGLRPATDGSVIVVANTAAGTLDLIDPVTDRPSGTVSVGTEPVQVAVTNDGSYAYTGVTDPATVVKVDLRSGQVVGSARVSATPVQLYLTPDETTVVAADQGTADAPGHTLSVIDTAAMTVRGGVGTGSGPHGVVIDNFGTQAWVTNTYDDTVSVVDLAKLSVLATVPVGAEPSGISYSPHPPATSSAATVTVDVPAPQANTEQQPSGHGH